MSPTSRHQLVVDCDLAAFRSVGPWLADAIDDPGVVSRAELAVQELAVNALEHGFGDGRSAPPLTIEVARAADGWSIKLRDRGDAIPESVARGVLPTAPQVGGYGLFLVFELADDAGLERIDDTNVWTLRFDRR